MNIFISCVKKKKNKRCKAEELYDSPMFKKGLKYAKLLNGKIYILSTKYGLLELNDIIEPYELTLKTFNKQQKKEWAKRVYKQMIDKNINFNEKAIFLCGSNYNENLKNLFTNVELPLKNLSMGNILKFYNIKIKELSNEKEN